MGAVKPQPGPTPEEITTLEEAARAVQGWSCCNQAWLDPEGEDQEAFVGVRKEGSETEYRITRVDCGECWAPNDSLPLATFYAMANPFMVLQLIGKIRELENALVG